MERHSQKTAYADPTSALTDYLDDLLHVATTTVSEEPKPAVAQEPAPPAAAPENKVDLAEKQAEREARRARVRAVAERARARRVEKTSVAEQPQVQTRGAEAPLTPALREESKEAPEAAITPIIETTPQPVATPEPEPQAQGLPDWAGHAFECLIFKVAGLQLAVPLVLLGAIHRVESELHEIPGRPPWFMGMLSSSERNLRVVDTAEWVMAGRVPQGAREGYKFVIRLDQSDWGLACDEVAQSFTLSPDDVRWRSERSRRPWLAGTVVGHMCALLDVSAMTRLLSRAEKEHRLDLS
ncbi:chemotaxis protein CheW [Marinobacter nanhaiticus D15-8W]|uniref:Chemotaxis protein CheW n=1 Tax=Marinobacter nanhaiticus D15-8W TaxID=626887 RepID=N6X0U5_9GAMM|nr:chemotaxis protein CheW [Marinobacter nanhaiticus]ENO17057.1 chemotaxis protein CheW [Marinobacter nanhaiticus D15-8W]BES71947.1 chemotaxis protein CheW [Marinobacter nanhaiticus D15-8W]